MPQYRLLLFACVLLRFFDGSIAQGCTERQYEGCFAMFGPYQQNVTHMYEVTIIPTFEDIFLEDLCGRFEIFDKCELKFHHMCSLQVQLIVDALKDQFTFLCDTREEFKAYRPCYSNPAVYGSLQHCNDTFHSTMDAILDPSAVHLCNAVRAYVICVEYRLKDACGSDASKWAMNWEIKSLEQLSDFLDCSLLPGACTEVYIDQCLGTLHNHSAIDYAELLIPPGTEDDVDQSCHEFTNFESCVAPFKKNCSQEEYSLYEGVEDFFRWFCKGGRKQYLTNTPCWKELLNPTSVEAAQTCQLKFYIRVDAYPRSTPAGCGGRHSCLCGFLTDYLQCIYDLIVSTSKCDQSAAEWHYTYDVKFISPVVEFYMGERCQLVDEKKDEDKDKKEEDKEKLNQKEKEGTNTPLIVGIVAACVLVLLLLIVVIIFLVVRRRRGRPQRSGHGHIEMPPASGPPPSYDSAQRFHGLPEYGQQDGATSLQFSSPFYETPLSYQPGTEPPLPFKEHVYDNWDEQDTEGPLPDKERF